MDVRQWILRFTALFPVLAMAADLTVEEAERFPEENSGKVVFSTSFEPLENKAFTLRNEARIVKAGINGTMALEISRRSKGTYSVSGISLGKLPPGNYELSVMMRGENIRDSRGVRSQKIQAISVEHW